MKQPPTPISQAELNQIFDEQHWQDRLKSFERLEIYNQLSMGYTSPFIRCCSPSFSVVPILLSTRRSFVQDAGLAIQA